MTPPSPTGPVEQTAAESSAYDLKFVAVDEEYSDGAWYRELPDARLEVMSHARLRRVALGNCEPDQKAREVVAEIAKEESAAASDGAASP